MKYTNHSKVYAVVKIWNGQEGHPDFQIFSKKKEAVARRDEILKIIEKGGGYKECYILPKIVWKEDKNRTTDCNG